jgi:DNA-binding winged helix-turn-helix (wHTH) protein
MSGTGNESCTTIRFGLFELDTRSGELRKRGVKLKLSDQTYSILRALLNFPGEVVTRDQLIQAVWPDRTFVDFDSAINKSVSQIRRILGDSGPSDGGREPKNI